MRFTGSGIKGRIPLFYNVSAFFLASLVRYVDSQDDAAAMNRKERAADDPVTDLYSRRCAAIRAEKSRGTITVEFAAKAIQLAKEYKEKAQTDRAYANNQYP